MTNASEAPAGEKLLPQLQFMPAPEIICGYTKIAYIPGKTVEERDANSAAIRAYLDQHHIASGVSYGNARDEGRNQIEILNLNDSAYEKLQALLSQAAQSQG